ncbi:MAG: hypothetical protein CL843_19585 [Crocinitomicaceae bacterium]|nr:hypothetical protein [Crocinitomicaceae bacterium]
MTFMSPNEQTSQRKLPERVSVEHALGKEFDVFRLKLDESKAVIVKHFESGIWRSARSKALVDLKEAAKLVMREVRAKRCGDSALIDEQRTGIRKLGIGPNTKRFRLIDVDDMHDRITESVRVQIRTIVETESGRVNKVTRDAYTVRKSHAYLIKAMQEHKLPLTEAFGDIAKGFAIAGGAIRVRVTRLDDAGGGPDVTLDDRRRIELEDAYRDWAKELIGEKSHPDRHLRHTAAIDIIAFGLSCRKVDAKHHKRNGWAKDNLIEALEVYCKLRGWD